MVFYEASMAFAVTAAICFSVIILVRLIFAKQFETKGTRIQLAMNWNKMKYLSYILVVFFFFCAIALGLNIIKLLTGFTPPIVMELLELLLDFLFLVAAIDSILLLAGTLWGDKE